MIPRNQVYELIAKRRAYFEKLGVLGKKRTTDEWLLLIGMAYGDACNKAVGFDDSHWVANGMLDVAAVCVSCMEQHGVVFGNDWGDVGSDDDRIGPVDTAFVLNAIDAERATQNHGAFALSNRSNAPSCYLAMFNSRLRAAFDSWGYPYGDYGGQKYLNAVLKMATIMVLGLESSQVAPDLLEDK